MKVQRLSIETFRNIEKVNIEPCDGVNVIYGENAQGKTNIVEAIWLCTGCKSFRGTKDKELVMFGKEKGKIDISFFSESREQTLSLLIQEKREMKLNDIKLSSCAKSIGEFLAVVFSPVHLSLIKQGPAERRKFLDIAISQLKPQYATYLTNYNRALKQRNAILKDVQYHSELMDMLDMFEDAVATYGAKIVEYRLSYLEKILPQVKEIYSGISSGKEDISLFYVQNEEGINFSDKESFLLRLRQARRIDILSGTTSVGPHRDDLEIMINGISARKYGSQGQQRSCALALKLGEANVIKSITGEMPVVLLDDVMSELDMARQDYILNHIKKWQVFITCCDPQAIFHLKEGKSFHIKDGRII